MPPPFGLTTEGFNAPVFSELRARVAQKIHDTINPTMDLSDSSLEGQMVAIFMS